MSKYLNEISNLSYDQIQAIIKRMEEDAANKKLAEQKHSSNTIKPVSKNVSVTT